MKITRILPYRVPPRWMFVKIETDEGVHGWGEAVVEGRARTVETAVQEFARDLVGQDASRNNDHWQMMYRSNFYRGGAILMSAIAGIDQALWDIKGKALGVPVYELLGGKVRDRMKVYSWVGGDRPGDIVEGMQKLMEGGFDTFKLNGTEEMAMLDSPRVVDAAVANIAGVHEALGTKVSFGLDFHGPFSAPMAKVLLKAPEAYPPRADPPPAPGPPQQRPAQPKPDPRKATIRIPVVRPAAAPTPEEPDPTDEGWE